MLQHYKSTRKAWDGLPEKCKKVLDGPVAKMALLLFAGEQSSYDHGYWDLEYPLSFMTPFPEEVFWHR